MATPVVSKTFIREQIIEVLQDILADPDYGLVLRSDFVKRLHKSVVAKKRGRVISFDDILQKYT